MKKRPFIDTPLLLMVSGSLPLLLIGAIAFQLAIATYQAPNPQAIFVLGGGIEREHFTAKFARSHPDLEIWVSTGVPNGQALAIFREAGIAETRLHLDRRAVDTVTNFTSFAQDFHDQGIRHVYLITSDFHMPRAKAIAFWVFGSRGITVTPIEVPSKKPDEPRIKIVRDIGRSLMWLMTGRTGASLNSELP